MVLKRKFANTTDVPPWTTAETIRGATDGVAWNWHDCLAAELGVMAARSALAEQCALNAQAEEFFTAYRYVARMGFFDFTVRFVQHLYFEWRYGIAPDDF